MNRPRRVLALAAAAAVAAASLTACSASSEGSGDEPVTITWWATNLANSLQRDNELLKPMIDRFTEETGIQVDYEVNTWGDYYNKVLGAVSSGEGPDVMSVGTTWTQTLADTGAFLQFDDARMDEIGGADKFVPTSLGAAGGDSDGGPSFLPMANGVTSLWYNPTIFAAAGITEPPKTIDEFITVAQQLTQDTDGDGTIDQYGFAYPAGSASELSHAIFAYGEQYDGQWFDEDGKPTLDADGIVDAATMLTALLTDAKIMSPADVEITNATETFQQFADGKTGMIFASGPIPTWKEAGFTDYAAADMPLIDPVIGEPVMTHIAGVNVGVFAETEHEEAALQFVKYLTDVEAQVDFYNDFDQMPTNQEAYDSDQLVKADTFDLYANILANNAKTVPLNSNTGQAETLMGDAMKQLFAQAALDGTVSTADAKAVFEQANSQLEAAAG
ncbi:extracellular solute-binding protein [Microbacteriaceae bacterium VKM Ac-2854]|nr:extracellular solute-binding protein [Microbacteriaceae bacterium VKM Ac-2854]